MTYLYYILIISLSAFLQGVTGFGLALIAVPLMLLFLDMTTIVVSLLFTTILLNPFLIRTIKHPADPHLLRLLIFSSVLGLPFGIYLLGVADLRVLKIAAGSLAILFTLILGFQAIRLPKSKTLLALSGLLAGVLQTSIAMSGPPVVLVLSAFCPNKHQLRKNLMIYFLIITFFAFVMFVINRTPVLEPMTYALAGIPFAWLGGYAGNYMANRVPQGIFRPIVFVVVFLTGCYTIYSAW